MQIEDLNFEALVDSLPDITSEDDMDDIIQHTLMILGVKSKPNEVIDILLSIKCIEFVILEPEELELVGFKKDKGQSTVFYVKEPKKGF